MKLQKPISLILALVLLFSMIPMQAAAATLAEPSAGSPVVKGESSVGAILGEAAQRNKQTENTSESISDVTVSGRTATVTLLHTKACMVVVGIYDETGKTLLQTAQKRDIAADAETAELTFDSDLPEHYTLRAFILDENCAPLGKAFETDRYTSAYEEFLGKTTADFPAKDVINFDNSASNNFAVYDSAVKEISTDGKNTPTIGENGYTFTDADDSLLTLAAGDIFTFNNNGTPEIVKVASVSVSGATVTVTPADAQMEEVFDYVKIDVTADQASLDMSSADDGVSYAPQNDNSVGAGADYELLRHFTLNIERGGIEGELDMTATLHFKLYYSGGILETELTDEVSGELDVSVGAKYEGSFRLCKLHFPTPVAGLMIAVEVAFAPEVSAKFNGKVEYSQKVGCAYSSKSGFRNLSQKPQLDAEVNFEGTVFIGFTVTPSIEALFGVVELGLECKLGAEGTGTRVLTTTDSKESDHLCRWCIDGTISGKAEISVELETGFWKKWKHTLKAKLLDWEKELFDFYYSANKGFGKGDCDNYRKPQTQSGDEIDPNMPTRCENCYIDYIDGTSVTFTGSGKLKYYNDPEFSEVDEENAGSYGYARCENWDTNECLYLDYSLEGIIEFNKHCYMGYDRSTYGWVTAKDYYFSGFTSIAYHQYFLGGDLSSATLHLEAPLVSVEPHAFDCDMIWRINYLEPNPFSMVELPNTIRYIGSYAFNRVPLKDDTLPASLEYIGSNAFDGTVSGNLTIPANVTMMGYGAIGGNNLKSATLLSEAPYALSGCKGLESATLGDDLTKINSSVFADCTSLKSITIPESVTTIGYNAFENSGLESVTIPKNVSKINSEAFRGCKNLREVVIEEGVKEIGSNAFADCPNLERVVLPKSITELREPVFANCPKLKISYSGTVDEWNNITVGYTLPEETPEHCSELYKSVYGDLQQQMETSQEEYRNSLEGIYNPNHTYISYEGLLHYGIDLLNSEYNYTWDNYLYSDSQKRFSDNVHYISKTSCLKYRMSDLQAYLKPDSSNPYLNGVVVYCNADGTTITPNNQGSDPVGANTANGYANAEYLIAVEDAENGKLGGAVRMLAQVQADGNGKVTVPDDIAAGEGEYLNLYSACRHPSAHLTEDNKYLCDICTGRLPAVIDLGKRPDDSGITTGDVNGDGTITITDVTEIQRHLAGLTQLSDQALARADTNGDGKIDIADATHLQKYLARYNVVLGKQAA